MASHATNPPGSNSLAAPIERNGHSPDTLSSNGSHAETNGLEAVDPITETEAIKESLRQLLERTNRLLGVLRRQKKQARLVQATLASLRELQVVG